MLQRDESGFRTCRMRSEGEDLWHFMAYQRLGKLGLAEEEADTSGRTSQRIDSDKNLAYCMKCSVE